MIDRCGERRRDPHWIAERLAEPSTRLIAMSHGRPLVCGTASGDGGDRDEMRPLFLPASSLDTLRATPDALIFLGIADDVAYFALALDDEQARIAADRAPVTDGAVASFVELRAAAAQLGQLESALLAYTRAMLLWDERYRFCATCGSPTVRGEAGHVRTCTTCDASHFPRTDPAVIVLVTHGDACLLGNHAGLPPDRFSTLAGFVEPGESLEDAVRREVYEEAGAMLATVRYHSSQPWPFPASLMIGFTAEAVDRTIQVDEHELRHARWFTRDELRDGIANGTARLSPPISIAHRLIEEWRTADPAAT
jgi:NAD+ diphosphatase